MKGEFAKPRVDVVVIGAGLAGLYLLVEPLPGSPLRHPVFNPHRGQRPDRPGSRQRLQHRDRRFGGTEYDVHASPICSFAVKYRISNLATRLKH